MNRISQTWHHMRRFLSEQYGLSWHSQNLTGDWYNGKRTGPLWRHGRAWFSWWGCSELDLERGGKHYGRSRPLLRWNIEWVFLTRRIRSLALRVVMGEGDSDDELLLHVSIPLLCSLFLGLEGLAKRDYRDGAREVEVSLGFYNDGIGDMGTLSWRFWLDPMSWDSKTPKWRDGHFRLLDWLLGAHTYSNEDLVVERAVVLMPEGSYPCMVRLFRSTWKRPRWPQSYSLVRADVTPDMPIPHPGKGENVWDCDEDATFSLTTSAATVADAVESLRATVLRTRRQYGGENWLPKKVSA